MSPTDQPPVDPETAARRRRRTRIILVVGVLMAGATFAVAALLVNIFQRKQEGQNRHVRLVEVTESTTDPAVWGVNWPRQYDGYRRTVDHERTRHGGSDAIPRQKLDADPWLRTMWSGYAFAIDYREARGHAYMLTDQEETERVKQRPQWGACLHCHASVMPAYRELGKGDVMAGFAKLNAMPYHEARHVTGADGKQLVQHPISCVDCHDPESMALRVTRPAFITGITELKRKEGVKDYDVHRDATRQEMRTFVCAQCHVEYYFKGKEKMLTYPWSKGLKIEEIEAHYDEEGYQDWTHGVTGAPTLKAQHPEFELWSQGIHAKSGVSCSDCHMPYKREGAMKVSDHHIRSPMLNISRSCQPCHNIPEAELAARVTTIQDRTRGLIDRAAEALSKMIAATVAARDAGATPEQLKPVLALQRRAQYRLDFVYSENSIGFHASQESARILAEAIDYARQGEVLATALRAPAAPKNTTEPEAVHGVTPTAPAPASQLPLGR